MIGFQNSKGEDLQKPIPGCVGMMINIFELSSGTPGTKLLTDTPHQDGSPTNRNRFEKVKKRPIDTIVIEDDPIPNDHKKGSSKKSGGTPMKMLIAQELSREVESRQKPTNVVARLMGLDTLPVQPSSLIPKSPSSNLEKEYKDVYEVWQQPSSVSRFRDQPPRKGRYDANSTERRMELIRQKFTEVRRLDTNESRLQSEEFQVALEVLSSNRELFLKFLEEPSSLISKHFCGIQSFPRSQIKRITVLKPLKTIEAKEEAQARKNLYLSVENDRNMDMSRKNSRVIHNRAEIISDTTRIVVLKPSPGKPDETLKQPEDRDFNGSLRTDKYKESREVAKEMARQMQQYLSSQRRYEALLSSSALSNGYMGDESSFNRSENDSNGEGCCDISDSEAVTPTSRHYWDYNNRFGSPCSISSCSPEPTVIREAKKRLSERCAMVALNWPCKDKNQMRRCSSTLGDILAIPEVRKEEESGNLTNSNRSCCGEQELKTSVGCFPTEMKVGCVGCGEHSRNLGRSKSLPVSSSVYVGNRLKEVVPDPLTSKTIVPKEVAKSKSGVSSFKGKVSSFFLPRSKKSRRENHIPSTSVGYENRLLASSAEASCKRNDGSSESFHNSNPEDSMLTNSEKFGASLAKTSLSFSSDNQDQPSPISVLETQFEDDANIFESSLRALCRNPQTLSRSPLIESVSRTLTWDSPHLGRPPSNSSKLSRVSSKECEEQERFAFVQKLLSYASLVDGDCTVLARWHSLDSPLDPMFLDQFLDRKKEEAKCRERRSNQRLMFDCVNAALLDIGWSAYIGSYPYSRAIARTWKDGKKCSLVTEEVWRLMRDWFSVENRNTAVEGLVKQEVSESGWTESMFLEIDELSKEIGGEVLEELVKEALEYLTCVCL